MNKIHNTKNWRNINVLATALLVTLLPLAAQAGALGETGLQIGKDCKHVTNRPLSDFLKAQGTSSNFFPPVRDYVGWADNPPMTFALVDYAGLANEYIKAQTGESLGTKIHGQLKECTLADGTARITVALLTNKAMGFAQSVAELEKNGFDFLNTPTIFGNKAQDIVNGKEAAVGPSKLMLTFTVPKPGANLPDLLEIINAPAPNPYAPVKMNFASITSGKRANGIKARLHVHEVASTNAEKELVFSQETVEITDTNGGTCVQ